MQGKKITQGCIKVVALIQATNPELKERHQSLEGKDTGGGGRCDKGWLDGGSLVE